MDLLLSTIAAEVIAGHADTVEDLVRRGLAAGTPAEMILDEALVAGMAVVGARFRENEIFVPEVLVSARAMKAGLTLLEPVFAACGVPSAGTCVIGTVKGDIHDIGKNLVAVMLRGAGLQVVDLGVNVPAQRFVDAAREHDAAIIALSALLTTTMGQMRGVADAVHAALPGTRILVGGAPVTREFATSIGADGWAPNAADAVDAALELLAARKA